MVSVPMVTVYPRECGGTIPDITPGTRGWGLSPRVRGNLVEIVQAVDRLGSIPASAGEPERAEVDLAKPRVYPRECGGTPSSADTR